MFYSWNQKHLSSRTEYLTDGAGMIVNFLLLLKGSMPKPICMFIFYCRCLLGTLTLLQMQKLLCFALLKSTWKHNFIIQKGCLRFRRRMTAKVCAFDSMRPWSLSMQDIRRTSKVKLIPPHVNLAFGKASAKINFDMPLEGSWVYFLQNNLFISISWVHCIRFAQYCWLSFCQLWTFIIHSTHNEYVL